MFMREYVTFVTQMKLKMRFILCSNVHVTMISDINEVTETKANFLLLNDVEKLRHVVKNHFFGVSQNLLLML